MCINRKGMLLKNTFVFILQLGVQRGASIGECSMFQKNCSWANEYGFFPQKKFFKNEGTHDPVQHKRV
jgi:hypothetical protein